MSHKVRVNSGYTNVELPDGNEYDGSVDVILTDSQFAQLSETAFTSGTLTDLGEVVGPSIDAVTVADGADVAQGTTTDAATANTVIGRLKKLISLLPTALGQTTKTASLSVAIASDQTVTTSVADGSDVALGATGDASSANTVIGRLKKLLSVLPAALGQAAKAGSLSVTVASDQTVDVAVASPAGTPADTGDQSVTTGAVISILAANAARHGATIQNTTAAGGSNARITNDGTAPTATKGLQVPPGGSMILAEPFCPRGVVKAIGETGTVTIAVEEVTA